jgi:hypothetical protein
MVEEQGLGPACFDCCELEHGIPASVKELIEKQVERLSQPPNRWESPPPGRILWEITIFGCGPYAGNVNPVCSLARPGQYRAIFMDDMRVWVRAAGCVSLLNRALQWPRDNRQNHNGISRERQGPRKIRRFPPARPRDSRQSCSRSTLARDSRPNKKTGPGGPA